MRGDEPIADNAPIAGISRRVFTLELDDVADDAIAGRLRDEHGDAVPFLGWLAFAGALEQALGRGPVDATSRANEGVKPDAP